MSDQVQKQVDDFVKLPRKERAEKYFSLPVAARRKARKQIESRRGIAYRGEGGVIVFTKEEYERQIAHFDERLKSVIHAKSVRKSVKKRLSNN